MDDHANLPRAAISGDAGFAGLIGESAPMRRLCELIAKVRQTNSPVLLLGETGTGKEPVARCIHFTGVHREGVFVPVDCAALTPTLIESELFGHAKGAFTGADHARRGLFEAANGGTLFLDEIGDLAVDMQAKLLRAIQEKEIRPVGSTCRNPVTVRLIAATSRDLDAAIQTGAFRQDLYFRLNVIRIKLPPLRERRSDIPLLAAHFLEKFCGSQQPVHKISEEAMQRLVAYDWPGNVRELENAIQCAAALSSSVTLHVKDLPHELQSLPPQCHCERDEPLALEEIMRRAIFRALEETCGNKYAAARLLGIGKTTLYRKLKQYSRSPLGS